MSNLAERVQEAVTRAKENGYTVAKIAEACSISRQSVYQWLDGATKSLDGSNLVELAELAGMNPRWIINGKGAKTGKLTQDEQTVLKGYRLASEEAREDWLEASKRRIKRAEDQKTNAA